MIGLALQLIAIAIFAPVLLWVFYVAVMRLKMVRDAGQLTGWTMVLGYIVLAVGLVLDLVVNLITASVIFRERPREWTVSARLTRLSAAVDDPKRQALAVRIRTMLLDNIDPAGIHTG